MLRVPIGRMKKPSREISFDELDALNRVPINDAVDALEEIQRRRILFELLAHDLQDGSPGMLVESEVAMNNVHLPKLADYGFIDWDQETGTVQRGPRFHEITPLIDLLVNHQDELPTGGP